MITYVMLMKLTQTGAAAVEYIPTWQESIAARVDELHGNIIAFVATLGIYDVIMVVELVSDEDAACVALHIAAEGNLSPTTLKGFGPENVPQYIGKK